MDHFWGADMPLACHLGGTCGSQGAAGHLWGSVEQLWGGDVSLVSHWWGAYGSLMGHWSALVGHLWVADGALVGTCGALLCLLWGICGSLRKGVVVHRSLWSSLGHLCGAVGRLWGT